MSGEKILVTGGAGFIGRHVVGRLLKRAYDVIVLDIARRPRTFPETVEYFQESILNQTAVNDIIKQCDSIIHLAAKPHLWAQDKASFDKINHLGTKNILQAAAKYSVEKIVYTSSETILKSGISKPGLIHEDVELPNIENLPGPYSRSKMKAELFARELAGYGLPIVIVYPTTPIGSGDYNLTPPTRMIMDFLNNKTPAFYNCALNFIAVDDVAEGHILALEKGDVGERYILGNQNMTLKEFLRLIEKSLDQKMPKKQVPYWLAMFTARFTEFWSDHVSRNAPVASREGVKLAGTSLIFDCSKALNELNLPQTPIQDAIFSCAEWLEKEYLLEEKINLKYARIKATIKTD